MIVDAAGPDRAAFARPFDLCVIGAGPAGITLARRAAAQGLEVALLEAGGREITEESQAVYEGEVVGRTSARLRIGSATSTARSNNWRRRARGVIQSVLAGRRRRRGFHTPGPPWYICRERMGGVHPLSGSIPG